MKKRNKEIEKRIKENDGGAETSTDIRTIRWNRKP